MPNSRLELPSDSKDGTFKFHFINSQELDATACSNIGAEALFRITENAYRSVFFCFPGSALPCWFPYRCQGHSITVKKDSLNWWNENKVIGFALCVVLRRVDIDDKRRCGFRYRLTFESEGGTHILPNHDELINQFYWKGEQRYFVHDHTFIWKYNLDFSTIHNKLFHAHNFTIEINNHDDHPNLISTVMVKEVWCLQVSNLYFVTLAYHKYFFQH